LREIYPELCWKAWHFKKLPRGYWTNPDNRRRYLKEVELELEIGTPISEYQSHTLDGWYRVKTSDILRLGGQSFLDYFGDSLVKALLSVYPDYPWMVWRFEKVPQRYWEDERHIFHYLCWLSNQLDIVIMEDWKRVSIHQVEAMEGGRLIKKHGGLQTLLARFFPQLTSPTIQSNARILRGKSENESAGCISNNYNAFNHTDYRIFYHHYGRNNEVTGVPLPFVAPSNVPQSIRH